MAQAPPAGEPIDLTPDEDLQQLDDEVPTDVPAGTIDSVPRGRCLERVAQKNVVVSVSSVAILVRHNFISSAVCEVEQFCIE